MNIKTISRWLKPMISSLILLSLLMMPLGNSYALEYCEAPKTELIFQLNRPDLGLDITCYGTQYETQGIITCSQKGYRIVFSEDFKKILKTLIENYTYEADIPEPLDWKKPIRHHGRD